MPAPALTIAVLAHNEEKRIAACLESLPLGGLNTVIHVVVNGSTDGTAGIADRFADQYANVIVHHYAEGGKARSWNRFVFEDLELFSPVHVFVDGDAIVAPGSLTGLAKTLSSNPRANAAAGLPMNGRNAEKYRAEFSEDHGLFGDLYAVRGPFLSRMKQAGICFPSDLIGDDGLIGALIKTDLGSEEHWCESRVVPCRDAGFYCETADLSKPHTAKIQYRRMINYSVRYFQNLIISDIMRGPGAKAIPDELASLYTEWLARFEPRRSLLWWWFDKQALKRIAHEAEMFKSPSQGRAVSG